MPLEAVVALLDDKHATWCSIGAYRCVPQVAVDLRYAVLNDIRGNIECVIAVAVTRYEVQLTVADQVDNLLGVGYGYAFARVVCRSVHRNDYALIFAHAAQGASQPAHLCSVDAERIVEIVVVQYVIESDKEAVAKLHSIVSLAKRTAIIA